jgi:hypothetical protein
MDGQVHALPHAAESAVRLVLGDASDSLKRFSAVSPGVKPFASRWTFEVFIESIVQCGSVQSSPTQRSGCILCGATGPQEGWAWLLRASCWASSWRSGVAQAVLVALS